MQIFIEKNLTVVVVVVFVVFSILVHANVNESIMKNEIFDILNITCNIDNDYFLFSSYLICFRSLFFLVERHS